MAGRRKRKDPVDIQVDSDPSLDIVLNKDPNKAYALVSTDDLRRMTLRGYEPVSVDDPAHPAYGDLTGEKMVGGQLRLMSTSRERAEAIAKQPVNEFARRTNGLHDALRAHAQANPGSKFEVQVER